MSNHTNLKKKLSNYKKMGIQTKISLIILRGIVHLDLELKRLINSYKKYRALNKCLSIKTE